MVPYKVVKVLIWCGSEVQGDLHYTR